MPVLAKSTRILNLTRIALKDREPYHVAELRGPDNLKYVASVGPNFLSVVCVPAPMRRDHLNYNWLAVLTPAIDQLESDRELFLKQRALTP